MNDVDKIKLKVINYIIKMEGGYVNHPDDKGGPTKYGVTQKVARGNGYAGDMKDLPLEWAKNYYEGRVWSPLKLDRIGDLCAALAFVMADYAVHSGNSRAAKTLQYVLNALNMKETLFNDLVIDGVIGEKTIGALKAFMEERGEEGRRVLTTFYNSVRQKFLLDITERRRKNETFIYGWGKRLYELSYEKVKEYLA